MDKHKNIILAENNKGRKIYSICHETEGTIVGHCRHKDRYVIYVVILLDNNERHHGYSAYNDEYYEYTFYNALADHSTRITCLDKREIRLFETKEALNNLIKILEL